MSVALMSHNRGQVVGFKLGDGVLPGTVTVHGGGAGGLRLGGANNLLITNVSYGESVNHQFTRSLGKSIYLYVFGDDFGNMQVSGMAFSSGVDDNCESGGTGNAGVDDVISFYKKFKASKVSNGGKVPQVTVTVGNSAPFVGFLIGFGLDMSDTENLITKYSMLIKTIPDVVEVDAGDVNKSGSFGPAQNNQPTMIGGPGYGGYTTT